jgi:DNA-binding NarL/FixJ family response regulator
VTELLKRYDELQVVGTATSGLKVVSHAPDLRPDVILLDVRRSGISGLELIPDLQALLPEATILLMGLYDAEVYREAALEAGAGAYIPKGNLITDLLPTIRRVLKAG